MGGRQCESVSKWKSMFMTPTWPKVLHIPSRNTNSPHIAMSLALSFGRLLAKNHGNDDIATNP
jgi:hypothetical protein